MAVKTFDPSQVSVIFGGAQLTGYADGTFISAERDNPSFNSVVGTDGEGARSKSSDKSGTVTLTLIQTSASNDVLSAIAALDEQTASGVFPLMIKDNLGSTLLSAQTAWIEKPATVSMGREIESREWVIKTDRLNIFVGGN